MRLMPAHISLRNAAIRVTLDALYFTGAFRLLRGRCGGDGVILTLHRVRPERPDAFQPNRALEITPEFLDSFIAGLRDHGLDFISLDELHRRLRGETAGGRFVCLTFDDGYRDNLQWAYPILRRHQVPFAIFVASDFADRRGHLWWCTLETAIAANDHVTIEMAGERRTFACRTPAAKDAAARAIHRALCALPSEGEVRAAVDDLAARMAIDTAAHCAAACMDWTELAAMAADPLVTIGAHTVTHPRLGKLAPADAWREMEGGEARIEHMLGIRPAHFAYPFGDAAAAGPREFAFAAELGFKNGSTTWAGVISAGHRRHLTSLPRISVNGDYQRLRHLRVLESGVATASRDGLRRLRPASRADRHYLPG
jgi:peptidoglycan/xylan/chitin deacetylase (PgdA/CDA1 family)